MSTDEEWEKWGQSDPYFGVITHEKFRNKNLSDEVKKEFFDSGRDHIGRILDLCRKHLDPRFEVRRAADFGCGTGRLVIPLAEISREVVGIDISPSMLREAQKNCEDLSLSNASFILSDDQLSKLQGQFNFIHSFIVFQHMPVKRGEQVLARLMDHLEDGGILALQFTYAKQRFASNWGVPFNEFLWKFARATKVRIRKLYKTLTGCKDPEMQMNPYNLNRLLFFLQSNGISTVHTELTDHSGEMGIFLYCQKPHSVSSAGSENA